MEIYERILKIIEFFEKNSQTQFAKKIGVSQGTFWGYLNPVGQLKIRKVLLDKINLVYPQISREWLFFGEGEMLKSDSPPPAKSAAAAAPPTPPALQQASSPVPLIGFAACSLQGWHGKMSIPVPVEPPTWHSGMVAVMASGESMVPAGIGHGHVCYCDTTKTPGLNEAVYVETTDDRGTIKLFCGWSERGGEQYLTLKGWQDKQPGSAGQVPLALDVIAADVRLIAPVIYVRRRL